MEKPRLVYSNPNHDGALTSKEAKAVEDLGPVGASDDHIEFPALPRPPETDEKLLQDLGFTEEDVYDKGFRYPKGGEGLHSV